MVCIYPSIHFSLDEDTLEITVGCPLCTFPSIRNKNLHTCWTPWSTQETRGLWARPPVLSPVPSQAVHSRACLNSHHSDIQGTAQKSPCVDTLFEAIALTTSPETTKKNLFFFFVTRESWAGHTTKTTAQENRPHVTIIMCDIFLFFFFCKTHRGPEPYTSRRAMQRSRLDMRGADAGAGGMSIRSGMGASSSSSDTFSTGSGS